MKHEEDEASSLTVRRTQIRYSSQPSKRPKGEKGLEGILLAVVPSNTKKGKTYEILLDQHNSVFCTCDGWFFRHECSHLTAFRERLARRTKRDAARA